MIEIKVPSQQRYTRVDIMSTSTNKTYLVFAYDFKTLTKEEKESRAIDSLINRIRYQLRRGILEIESHLKKLSLKDIIEEVEYDVRENILLELNELPKIFSNLQVLQNYKRTLEDKEFELTEELALLERFDMINSVFVTFSLDENNDTLIIHDSFQNGQQMLNFTQTTQGLVHQIDVKRASTSNQGELLISIKYQKEG